MKVFISFDMEGVAGIVDWSQCRPPGQPYEEGRALLLGEVNAAIDGALAGGATEIVCNDSHGTMNNLNPADLHGRARYVAGRHKPLYMMEGMDASADAVFFVGYHGSISGDSSVLSHTYNPSVVSRVELNGAECGESGINGLVALACAAPVVLITGDQQTAAEGEPVLQGRGAGGGEGVDHPVRRRPAAPAGCPRQDRGRRDGGGRGGRARCRCRTSRCPPGSTCTCRPRTWRSVASWVKGVERTGTRTVRVEGDDPLAVYRSFVAITYITRVAEGR